MLNPQLTNPANKQTGCFDPENRVLRGQQSASLPKDASTKEVDTTPIQALDPTKAPPPFNTQAQSAPLGTPSRDPSLQAPPSAHQTMQSNVQGIDGINQDWNEVIDRLVCQGYTPAITEKTVMATKKKAQTQASRGRGCGRGGRAGPQQL